MIDTVTFAPALDYALWLPHIQPGATNRAEQTRLTVGGKGVNVSILLTRLGVPTRCLGFAAGFVGQEIVRRLDRDGICQELLMLPEGVSRINVKLKSDTETEINANGPAISPEAMERLMKQLSRLGSEDTLVLSGKPPAECGDDLYRRIMERLAPAGVRVVVDAAGDLLRNVLPMKPWLIKPNRDELEKLAGRPLPTQRELIQEGQALRRMGAQQVLISLGGDGAILVCGDGVFTCGTPQGTLRNSTGAGDSMVAGFLAARQQGLSPAQSLRFAVAAGSASAFAWDLATAGEIADLLPSVPAVKEIETR